MPHFHMLKILFYLKNVDEIEKNMTENSLHKSWKNH